MSRTLKGTKPYGVSPEVFGAWFTGFGKMDGINYVEDVRIMNPSAGLKQWYEQRARILEQYIQEIRKTKPAPTPKKEEAKPAEAKPAETKPAEPAKPARRKQTPQRRLRRSSDRAGTRAGGDRRPGLSLARTSINRASFGLRAIPKD